MARTVPRFAKLRQGPRGWSPGVFFLIDVAWIAALLVVAFGQASGWGWLRSIKDPFSGVVPFAVPWAGALGGVAISFVGVVGHSSAWNGPRFAYWHLARPILGCVFGTVAVLAVLLVLQNIKLADATNGYKPTGVAILAVISFVVGYREATFRALVVRIADVILGPGPLDAARPIALVPEVVEFNHAALGVATTVTVHLFNGSADTIHLNPSGVSVGPFTGLTIAPPVADVDIPPNGSTTITVEWTPQAPDLKLDSTLKLNVANTTLQAAIRGTAQ
jgi:hypothetical protein